MNVGRDVGVMVDETRGDDQARRVELNASAPCGQAIPRDTGAHTAAAYRTTGYPETFVIDRDGTVLRTFVGPAEWDTPDALAYFRGLLPRRPAATERSTSPAR